MGVCSVSVDLDSLHHYCRIYGLPESLLDDRARGLMHDAVLPRYAELFARAGITPTFFVIGEDLSDRTYADALRTAREAGAEIGSHSHAHDYALAFREPAEIAADLVAADRAIEDAVGARPVGFRAPGYTLSAELYRAICDLAYHYDSSAFPAVPYYAVKAAVRSALALLGKPSATVLDSPRVLLAPRMPYAPDLAMPYRKGHGGSALELPIATAPFTRVPFYGTLVTSLPQPAVRAIYRTLRGEPFFNLELHAIDVLDVEDGVPREIAARQRDLFIPRALKMERIAGVLDWLVHDFEPMTLAAAAGRFGET